MNNDKLIQIKTHICKIFGYENPQFLKILYNSTNNYFGFTTVEFPKNYNTYKQLGYEDVTDEEIIQLSLRTKTKKGVCKNLIKVLKVL